MLRRAFAAPTATLGGRTALKLLPTVAPTLLRSAKVPLPLRTGAAVVTPQRHYATSSPGGGGSSGSAGSRQPLDSDKSDVFSSQHFDLQDVDADRLTHFFWDRNEDGGSPYMMDDTMVSELDEVLLMSEDNFENAWFVDPRDRRLLFNEYLYV